MSREEALEILEEIEENVNVCCAVTMEPDDVLDLIDKLKKFLNEKNTQWYKIKTRVNYISK